MKRSLFASHLWHGFWLAIVTAFMVTACATLDTPKTPQEAIDKTNIVLIAAANNVRDNVKSGVMTRDEALAAMAKLKELAAMTDEAQGLLDQGLAIQAQDKVKLVNTLLTSLQREIAQKAREVK